MSTVSATILDGKATKNAIYEELRARVAALAERGAQPGLGTVLVGDDPGSHSYVRGKHNDCAKLGIASLRRELPADVDQATVESTLDELNDLKTAVSEAVTNCIVHAYPDRIGPVTLCVAVYPEREVHITVTDKGVGIPDVPQAMEPLFTTGNPEERSGLGFAVMQSFMDRVKVTSRPGKGTKVVLIKRLSARAST